MGSDPKTPKVFPTSFQRKTLWSAITAASVVTIGAIAVGIVWLGSKVLGFLQPILIPFAIAGVMAYLLDPLVDWLQRRWMTRGKAVISVFAIVTLTCAGVLVWVIPALYKQTAKFAQDIPGYTQRAQELALKVNTHIRDKFHLNLIPDFSLKKEADPVPATELVVPLISGTTPAPEAALPLLTFPFSLFSSGAGDETDFEIREIFSGDWLKKTLPTMGKSIWKFITSSVGGFLGVFGFLLSMVIVPIYLFYFLIESKNIASSWGSYLPLRASAFKDEVVNALEEINKYLIAFFRGQLLVSVINGVSTGVGLMVIGLDFGLLIGLGLCVLGIIPYLGIILCWIPAVIIALVQGSSWMIPDSTWWLLPLVVTGVFVVVQQIDGFFITPKIVGESVGLHPLTVIISVFVWSLLMGGLLGAILAVPMTATLKVLLVRYVWQRRDSEGDAVVPNT